MTPWSGPSALSFAALYAAVIVWLYASQPQTGAEALGGLAATVGAYRVDRRRSTKGLAFFHRDLFPSRGWRSPAPTRRGATRARSSTSPIRSTVRDGAASIAMTRCFEQGVEAVDRAIAVAPAGRVIVDDPRLGMRSSDELKAELERGLRRDASRLQSVARVRPTQMTPLRESFFLPGLFLTVTLLGGLRVGTAIRLVPPSLSAIVLAVS